MKNNVLELTWVGKYDDKKIEPRILIEDKEKSYGDGNTKNMLIHGDNLLVLKSLQSTHCGKIKCIFIDPPFNTGKAFEHYNDNLEHSIWLNLMYLRIKEFYKLLSEDGVLLIEIDDNEMPYLRVILDEVFGRDKFVASICVRSNSISGNKTANKNKTILRNKDNIIVYKKNNNIIVKPQYIEKEKWDTHYNSFLEFNSDNTIKVRKLKEVLIENNIIKEKDIIREDIINNQEFYKFALNHRKNICRLVNSISVPLKKLSLDKPNEIVKIVDDNGIIRFALNGSRVSFLESTIKNIDGKEKISQLLGDLWTDVDFQNTQNEGVGSFTSNKKPEYLIRRILDIFTNDGDLVLDSFLGSGTTCAVAHKMNRNWIGVEMGNHIYSHCIPRFKKIIDGLDNSGVTKYADCKNILGGYKFYELAPSLLNKDNYDNWVISSEYDADMLSESMCIHNGFKYIKEQDVYFKQGFSTDNDYIYTTTNFVTIQYLEMIEKCMKPNETLLICCKSFDEECLYKFKNISIQKIPNSILKKYEFGDVNYTLNVVEVDNEEEIEED